MKKIVLILITLILVAGMVFATEPVTSTVKITGTIAPTPSGNVDEDPVVGDENGLWIYSYVQTFNSNDITAPKKYNATNDLLELNSEYDNIDVLHDKDGEDSIDSLAIVYGVLCDVAAVSSNPPAYIITIEAPEYFNLVTGTSGDVATTEDDDTFALTVVTSLPDKKEIDFADSSSDTAKLSLSETKAGDGIEITTAAGLSNRSATTPELVGWTAVTWDTAAEKIPVAGTYTADIKIKIASK